MIIRKFELDDFEEVVGMYQALTAEIYCDRKQGAKYFFYRTVVDWVANGRNIIIADKDGEVVGFTMGYIDPCGGVTETVYNGELAYVKPKYRKTRAAYMLYHNVSNFAKEQGLTLVANAYIGGNDNVDKIQQKLGGKPKFISMERIINA